MFDFRFNRPADPADPTAEPQAVTGQPDPVEDVEWTAPPPPVTDPPARQPSAEPVAAETPAAVLADDASEAGAGLPALPPPYAPPAGWTPPDASASEASPAAAPVATAERPGDAQPVRPVMIVRPAREDPPADDGPAEAGDDRLPVLVVEDNLDTRMLLERILRGTYAVTAVGDARSALAAMARTRFRGFVLDINLGGKETGADVLRIARALDGYADVYAVALTAYALPGDRERLLESGFDEYISKPFTRQSLMDALAAGVKA